MKIKLWITKVFISLIFMPYITLFVNLWKNKHQALAMLTALFVSAIYITIEEIYKRIKKK